MQGYSWLFFITSPCFVIIEERLETRPPWRTVLKRRVCGDPLMWNFPTVDRVLSRIPLVSAVVRGGLVLVASYPLTPMWGCHNYRRNVVVSLVCAASSSIRCDFGSLNEDTNLARCLLQWLTRQGSDAASSSSTAVFADVRRPFDRLSTLRIGTYPSICVWRPSWRPWWWYVHLCTSYISYLGSCCILHIQLPNTDCPVGKSRTVRPWYVNLML